MKSFKIFYYIVCVFIGLITILLIVSVFPVTGNFKVKVVESGSMESAIKTGSIITIKPEEDYKIGDIVTFQATTKLKELITHRIYDIQVTEGEPRYITKGDANNAPDQKEVLQKDIIGRVVFHIPYLGYVVSFSKKPIGFILIIIIPAGIIVSDEIRKIWKEIVRLKNKKKDEEQDKEIKKNKAKDIGQDKDIRGNEDEIKKLKKEIRQLKSKKPEIKKKSLGVSKKKNES